MALNTLKSGLERVNAVGLAPRRAAVLKLSGVLLANCRKFGKWSQNCFVCDIT